MSWEHIRLKKGALEVAFKARPLPSSLQFGISAFIIWVQSNKHHLEKPRVLTGKNRWIFPLAAWSKVDMQCLLASCCFCHTKFLKGQSQETLRICIELTLIALYCQFNVNLGCYQLEHFLLIKHVRNACTLHFSCFAWKAHGWHVTCDLIMIIKDVQVCMK